MNRLGPLLCLSLANWMSATASAQQVGGNPLAGEELARQQCAECHVIGTRGQLSVPEGEAPSFYAMANSPHVTEMALRTFLQTPHGRMPNIVLTPAHRDDLVAYILNLRRTCRPWAPVSRPTAR